MIPIVDYHIHTPLCGHAVGEPLEYAEAAIEAGLEEIGFSDHAPFVHYEDPGITMNVKQLPEYYRMMEDVRKKYSNCLRVKIGIEADYIPGYEHKTKAILEDYPYDFVIGSVHFIKDWGFDNPEEFEKWDEQDVDQVYRDYYALLRQSAQSGMYDIMGHVDLVKKFGHRSTQDFTDEIKKTARVFKECGVAIEINTSGLRKPVREMYPSLLNLKIYADVGVPLIFGSDSHDPKDVGRDFEKAVVLAREAGYGEYVLFKGRKIERTVKI
ncbi:MAG: histidinol-phosphatase HisJ [Candidatus Omnitrophica bacterium]|nr:histidinol-phosphatase HisJ [Candidatus Omnitrophota bacterium]